MTAKNLLNLILTSALLSSISSVASANDIETYIFNDVNRNGGTISGELIYEESTQSFLSGSTFTVHDPLTHFSFQWTEGFPGNSAYVNTAGSPDSDNSLTVDANFSSSEGSIQLAIWGAPDPVGGKLTSITETGLGGGSLTVYAGSTDSFSETSSASVPEPHMVTLFALGISLVSLARRRSLNRCA